MIKISNNELQLNDGTFYDLSKTSKKRVLQGLVQQLQDGYLTKDEYEQCIKLMDREEALITLKELQEDYKEFGPKKDAQALEYAIKELTAQEVPVQEQSDSSIITRVGNTQVIIDKDGITLNSPDIIIQSR